MQKRIFFMFTVAFFLLFTFGCGNDKTPSVDSETDDSGTDTDGYVPVVSTDNVTETSSGQSDLSPYDAAIAKAYKDSILYAGNDNNRSAIAAVMAKAESGEEIIIAALGDSITAGAGASDSSGAWASLVRDWIADRFPESKVKLINAGIGSTEGVFGVCRIDKDVLSYRPDLVIVDFGTNDYGQEYAQEAYEGILCKLISRGIATINFNVCPRNGNNIQDLQKPVNRLYGVPQISFRSAYYDKLDENANIEGLRSEDIWSSDTVHPTSAGHKLIAQLITTYLEKEIIDAHLTPEPQSTALPSPLTENGYADAVLIENTSAEQPFVTVNTGEWTADYSARIYQLKTEGWKTSTFESTLTFEVNSGYFEIFFALTPISGNLEINVDGTVTSTISYAYLGTGYMNPYHIIHFDKPGTHIIELTLKKNPNVEKAWFGICAVGVSNFN